MLKVSLIAHTPDPERVVAAAANASLVPCRIIYAEGHPRLFRRVTVVFGDPMPCSQLGLEAEGRSAAGLRRAKAWLAGEWEKLYLANTTPAQQEKDRQRAQQEGILLFTTSLSEFEAAAAFAAVFGA